MFKIFYVVVNINPLIAELNPICHLLALFGAHHILHVSRINCSSLLISEDYMSVIVTKCSYEIKCL